MALDDKAVNLRDLKVSHDDLDGKVTDLKSDLNSAVENISDFVGYNLPTVNTINKTNSRTYISVNDAKTIISADKGDKVIVSVSGTALDPSGNTKVYAWYGDSSTATLILQNQPINTDIEIILADDITAVALCPLLLTTNGTIVISACASVSFGLNKKIDDAVLELSEEIDEIPDSIQQQYLDTGKNLYNGSFKYGEYDENNDGEFNPTTRRDRIAMDTKIPVSPSSTYTFSWESGLNKDERIYIFYWTENESLISRDSYYSMASTSKTVTTPENCGYIGVYIIWYNHDIVAPTRFQIEEGNKQTSYNANKTIRSEYIDSRDVAKKLKQDGYLDGIEDVPGYYLENDYLLNKIGRIETLCKGCVGHGDAFFFITDEHWTVNERNSIPLIGYISKSTNVNRLFSGGDVSDYGTTVNGVLATRDFCDKLREAFGGSIYHVVGNHEYFENASGSDLYYLMDMHNNDQIAGNMDRHYYYVDNTQQKIRYIILAAFNEISGGSIQMGYEQEQLDWLENTALNMEYGWGAIIFTHYLRQNYAGTEETAVMNILDSYDGNGEIIAVIQGHMHEDHVWATPGGIPVICVTCDKNQPWIDGQNINREPWLNDRTAGTIKEQAFDVMVVNRANKTITQVRIGCPIREGTDPEQWTEYEEATTSYARA